MQIIPNISEFPHPSLLQFFYEISAIPRPSGKEEQIADYLCTFAKEKGLFYHRDEVHNVLIRRPHTEGYAQHPPILLQGHTDMVCEKTPNSTHDFEKDPLELYEEDGWLKARNTTLGADNGVAVATMLALLSDQTYEGPTLECLFTADEESGMTGAQHFDCSLLQAKRAINLDTESTEEVILGSAGNLTLCGSFSLEGHRTNATMQPFSQSVRLTVSGLASGHSGTDIGFGRQNAILLCNALLWRLYQEEPFALISYEGGGRQNVIPASCQAQIAVCDAAKTIAFFKEAAKEFYPILSKSDKGLKIHANRVGLADTLSVLDLGTTGKILRTLSALPNGVLEKMPDEDFVLTSSNLGIFQMQEEKATFVCMTRSMRMDAIKRLQDRFLALSALCGFSLEIDNLSPAWEKTQDGALARAYAEFYREKAGKDARFIVVHAGLECGLIQSHCPNGMEFLSIGPHMEEIHTVKERLHLASFSDFYTFLRAFLKTL